MRSFSEHLERKQAHFSARTGLARDLLIRIMPRRSTVEQASNQPTGKEMENGKILLQALRSELQQRAVIDGFKLSPASGGMQQGQA